MVSKKKGKSPKKKLFRKADAAEVDPFDTDSDSDKSFDSVREAAFIEGEDPDLDNLSDDEWVPPKRARQTSPSAFSGTPGPTTTPTKFLTATPTKYLKATPTKSPTTTPTSGKRRGRAGPSPRGRSAQQAQESWLDKSEADEEPPAVNFTPKRPPGPQLLATAKYSPLQLFQLFFTTSVVDTIIRNTNKFAIKRAKAGKKFLWVPLDIKEFFVYIGIVIYMGLVNAKTIADYWARREIYNFPFPQFAMSRSRFYAISWNLKLSNMKDDEENEKKKGTPAYDKLCKIKPLYTDIVLACKTYFHPQKHLSVDERMVASRARINLKQYIKDKPTKWGYKLFVLADSSCGYTWNFYVHEGRSSNESGKGASYETVMRLMDFPLLGQGYQVFMDNFYTSPTLFYDLLLKYTQACGTIRPNRQGFPKTKINDFSKNSKRGDIRWIRHEKLLFVKWMDAREVNMCSTIHKAYSGNTIKRRVKTAEGDWKMDQIPVPAAVLEYNKYMGGVDLSDALIGYYNVLHKTRKWYKTFFFHFIDIAVVNGFILHNERLKLQNKTPLTQKMFREQLILELIKDKVPDTSAASSSAASSSDPLSKMCLPDYFGNDATASRRVCVLCKKNEKKVKTPVYCTKCDVALCFVSSRNCFQRWHTKGHSSSEVSNSVAQEGKTESTP